MKYKNSTKGDHMSLPKDPIILLSFINTQLRDNFNSLEDLCYHFSVLPEDLIKKITSIDYIYDRSQNQFITSEAMTSFHNKK